MHLGLVSCYIHHGPGPDLPHLFVRIHYHPAMRTPNCILCILCAQPTSYHPAMRHTSNCRLCILCALCTLHTTHYHPLLSPCYARIAVHTVRTTNYIYLHTAIPFILSYLYATSYQIHCGESTCHAQVALHTLQYIVPDTLQSACCTIMLLSVPSHYLCKFQVER